MRPAARLHVTVTVTVTVTASVLLTLAACADDRDATIPDRHVVTNAPKRDPCASASTASLASVTAIDASTRHVTIDVASADARTMVTGLLNPDDTTVLAGPAPATLPPGPWQDKPAHPPRDFLADLITSAVVGIVDVTLVPLSVVPHLLSGGSQPIVPFIEPPLLTYTERNLFDDAVLDVDEWKAEVRHRAEAYEAAAKAARAQREALPPSALTCSAAHACQLAALLPARTHTLDVSVQARGCPTRIVSVDVPASNATASSEPALDDGSGRGAGAARTRASWAARAALAPSWSDGFPQPKDANALFASLPKKSARAALDDDELVCRVQAAPGFDMIGQADLLVRVAVGYLDVAATSLRGPDDSDLYTFALPGLFVAPGDKVKLSVVDVDAVNDDWVGASSVVYAGTPLSLSSPHGFTAECRVESAPAQARRRALTATATASALAVQKRNSATTRPLRVDEALRRDVEDLASAGGWSTPEAARAVADCAALREVWRARRAVDVRAHGVDQLALPGGARVRFAGVDTSEALRGALLLVDVPAEQTTPLHVSLTTLVRGAELVDALGDRIALLDHGETTEVDVDADHPATISLERWGDSDEAPFTLLLGNGKLLRQTPSSGP